MAKPYAAGDQVYFRGAFGAGAVSSYKVVRALPVENDSAVRYRIKNATENFERVANEDQLSREP